MFSTSCKHMGIFRIGNLRNGILLNLALIIGYTGSILLGSIITYTIDPNFENTSMMAIFEMSIFFGFVIFMFWIKIRYMIKWTREFNQKIS